MHGLRVFDPTPAPPEPECPAAPPIPLDNLTLGELFAEANTAGSRWINAAHLAFAARWEDRSAARIVCDRARRRYEAAYVRLVGKAPGAAADLNECVQWQVGNVRRGGPLPWGCYPAWGADQAPRPDVLAELGSEGGAA